MAEKITTRFVCASALILTISSASLCLAETDLCKQLAVEKEYDKAIEACTKQINGEVAVRHLEYSYSNRGAAYANSKQYDKAISDYSKAIKLNPEFATSYYNRAIAYTNNGQYDEAISDFNKVIELSPKDSAAYVGRATALANKKLYDQAILDFTMAIELNPNETAAYHNRAMVYARKKEFARAVSDRNKAIELSASAAPSSAPEVSSASSQARKAIYYVQLGMFKSKKNATALAKRFRKKGYDAFVMKRQKGKGILYRVLVGKSEDRHGSEKLAAKIKKKEKITPVIFSE